MLSRSRSAGRSEKASFITLVTSWESCRDISGLTWYDNTIRGGQDLARTSHLLYNLLAVIVQKFIDGVGQQLVLAVEKVVELNVDVTDPEINIKV